VQTATQRSIQPASRPWRYFLGRNHQWNELNGLEIILRGLVLLCFAAFFALPLIWLLAAPTRNWQDMYDLTRSPLEVGPLSNYLVAWGNIINFSDESMLKWTINSVWYSLASVFLSVAVAVPTGYVLATMKFRARKLVMWLTLITMILPGSAMVLPLFLEMSALRLVNNPLSVILPAAFAPFGVYLSYVYYSVSMPKDLLAAGKVDGCNEWQLFWHVGAPLGRTIIATLAFLNFNGAWNNYFLPFVMLNHSENYNLPLGVAVLLQHSLVDQRLTPLNEPEKALGAMFMIVPVLLVFLFAQKYVVQGMAAGAVKE
jgi:multiple sugar transport system permease protein